MKKTSDTLFIKPTVNLDIDFLMNKVDDFKNNFSILKKDKDCLKYITEKEKFEIKLYLTKDTKINLQRNRLSDVLFRTIKISLLDKKHCLYKYLNDQISKENLKKEIVININHNIDVFLNNIKLEYLKDVNSLLEYEFIPYLLTREDFISFLEQIDYNSNVNKYKYKENLEFFAEYLDIDCIFLSSKNWNIFYVATNISISKLENYQINQYYINKFNSMKHNILELSNQKIYRYSDYIFYGLYFKLFNHQEIDFIYNNLYSKYYENIIDVQSDQKVDEINLLLKYNNYNKQILKQAKVLICEIDFDAIKHSIKISRLLSNNYKVYIDLSGLLITDIYKLDKNPADVVQKIKADIIDTLFNKIKILAELNNISEKELNYRINNHIVFDFNLY